MPMLFVAVVLPADVTAVETLVELLPIITFSMVTLLSQASSGLRRT